MSDEQREILDKIEFLIMDYGASFRAREVAQHIIDHIEENLERAI